MEYRERRNEKLFPRADRNRTCTYVGQSRGLRELPEPLLCRKGTALFRQWCWYMDPGPMTGIEPIGPNKPFRDLAWGLAQQGIAVYRYDKRTMVYGQEMAADTQLTLNEETVEDAKDAVALLRSQEKIDPEHVYVLGHSLGGEAFAKD